MVYTRLINTRDAECDAPSPTVLHNLCTGSEGRSRLSSASGCGQPGVPEGSRARVAEAGGVLDCFRNDGPVGVGFFGQRCCDHQHLTVLFGALGACAAG